MIAREVDRTYDWFTWRLKAFRETLNNRLGQDAEAYFAIDADVAKAVTRLLHEQPQITALFALNDHIAYQAMRAAIAAGRSVPGTLSIVGIDGTIKTLEGLPALTTVAFPHEEVGYLAAELLIKQIENSNLRNARLVVSSHLIPGASCAEPRGVT